VADRPIIFSGPMVRALLDGRKTMTRRVLKPQPPADLGLVGIYAPKLTAVFGYVTPDADCKVALRYMPGDRLWVREAWRIPYMDNIYSPSDIAAHAIEAGYSSPWSAIEYMADGERVNWKPVFGDPGRVRAGMHMPRWASRLTLIVKGVRVQRVQDISEQDAIAEGCPGRLGPNPDFPDEWDPSPVEEYSGLWDELNARRPGCSWSDNPWVVALTFDVVKANIDALDLAEEREG